MRGAFHVFTVCMATAIAGSFAALPAQENAPDTVIFRNSTPLGGVKFAHAAHQDLTDCTTCHHESRPEKPLSSDQEACTSCHTNPPAAPMTTSIRDAFHDQRAQAGICVDCHVTEAADGKSVPAKCAECHDKELKETG